MRQQALQLAFETTSFHNNFIVSSANLAAYEWLRNIDNWPNHASVFYGAKASGKSHLISDWLNEQEGSAFSYQHISNFSLPEKPSKIAIVELDEKPLSQSQEQDLFHLYNRQKESRGKIIITMQIHPKYLELTLPDLKSRLLNAAATEIQSPDDELLMQLLMKHMSDKQLTTSVATIQYIMKHIERSFAAIKDFVESLDRYALTQKRAITIPLVKEFIRETI